MYDYFQVKRYNFKSYIVKTIKKPKRGNVLATRSFSLVDRCERTLLSVGPSINPIPNVAPIRPKYFGRNS